MGVFASRAEGEVISFSSDLSPQSRDFHHKVVTAGIIGLAGLSPPYANKDEKVIKYKILLDVLMKPKVVAALNS